MVSYCIYSKNKRKLINKAHAVISALGVGDEKNPTSM